MPGDLDHGRAEPTRCTGCVIFPRTRAGLAAIKPANLFLPHQTVYSVAFSRDGTTVAAGADHTGRPWKIK
jgi:WD40 repeat protein